ncbi:MAG TPA: TonB-dependent receptor, partial [Terriglobia bacterium]|nr:TonB-dependent receptor [Terriglobia bacterium]
NLTPGEYEVTASAPNFAVQTVNITLAVGSLQKLNFDLRVGFLNERVEVEAPPAGVDFATSTLGHVVNQDTIRQMPLNGRSWTDLASLEPGVAPIEAQVPYTAGVGRGNRGFGAQLAISGARPQQNNYLLDGISINDYSNGGPGSVLGGNLGVDAIQEFSIFTANYPAAYGKASGGVISAATRSGSNEFHGSVYEFFRNSALDARNFFDKATAPPFRRNQYGASSGGPVVKNQTFLFGDYEAIRQSLGVTNVVTVPSPAARNGTLSTGDVAVDRAAQRYLDFYPLPNGGLLGKGDTGIFTFAGQQVTNEDFVTGRLDHRFSERDTLFAAYHFDNARFTAPDNLDTELIGSATRNQTGAVELNHIFDATMLNTLRFGVNRAAAHNNESVSALIPQASDVSLGAAPYRTAASITVPGLSSFTGGLGGAGTYLFHYTSIQIYDDLYLTRGLHSMKFGFALERVRNNILALSNPNGQFTFNSLADFLTNRPASLSMGLSQTLSPRGLRQTVAGGYLQDDWRAHANLAINLGVRYEMATVPTEVQGKLSSLRNITDAEPHLGDPLFANPGLRNLQPRAGLSWDPFGDGKTAVRSGFGVYDVLPLTYQFELLASLVAPFYVNGTVTNPPPGSFPDRATSLLNAGSLARAYIEPAPHRNYAMQWNLNIQRTLARNLSAMIGYVGSHGVHNPFRTDDINMVLPTPTTAGYLWPSPAGSGMVINPNAGQIRALYWEGNSSYNALQLQVRRNMHRGFQIEGDFTWSKSIDNNSSTLVGNAFSNSFNGPHFYDLRLSRGVSDFNIPRVAVINGVWDVPSTTASGSAMRFLGNGWQLSSILKVSDGIPFTPLIAGDALGQKSAAPADFPNRLTGTDCNSLVNTGNPIHYIKTQCFAFPAPGTLLGNAGRNILTGPGLVNLDFAVVKNTRIRKMSDTSRAQFRAEIFNALNRANFLPPLDNLKLFDARGQPIASAGLLTATATAARQIQFALKMIW